MTMRLVVALAAAQIMGLLPDSSCKGFSVGGSHVQLLLGRRRSSALRVGTWDNDDFLASLSGKNPQSSSSSSSSRSLSGKDEQENEDLPSDSIPGAQLTAEMLSKMKQNQDQGEGGKMFKTMMEKAQNRQASVEPEGLKNPFVANPFAGIEGLDPSDVAPRVESPPPALDPNALTVEQQAQLFRAMLQGQAPALMNAKPAKADIRKTGRNQDADAIQNTADVYFAQLKRDSTVRGIARIRGDQDKANAVFQDEKIEELKSLIKENPHLA